MTITLRPYQNEAIAAIKSDWHAGINDVLLTCATGGGKTAIFLALLNNVLVSGKRGLVIAHRKELIDQPLARLYSYFPDWQGKAGIVMAGQNEPDKQLIVATVQTLATPGRVDQILEHGPIDYLVIDEAHHATASTYLGVYKQLKAANPDLRHLGVTATPIRADGDGLSKVYNKESAHFGIVELIQAGYLAPVRWLAIQVGISLAGVKSAGGDFVKSQLSNVFEVDNCFDLVVESHKKYSLERQAVAFTVSVDGAYRLAEKFRAAGISAAAADGTTRKDDRAQILKDFALGQIQVLCNVGLYTEGLDVPQASCIHQVRPTRSDGLYTQMVGRGMRTFPGKQDCIAEGQRVLTDHGLVPIEKVTKAMQVWDGESFVEHDGAICRGYQEVIKYAGLTATPDHKVWTDDGWKQLGECARNGIAIAVTGDGRAAIREIDGYRRNTCVQRQRKKEAVHTYALHNLWSRGTMESWKRPARACGMPEMRASGDTWPGVIAGSEVALQASTSRTSTLHKPKRTQLLALWRAGDRVSVQVASGNGRVGCIEPWLIQGHGIRPNQQQWSLRTWKSTVGNSYAECCQQHESEGERRISCFSHGTPGNPLRGYYITKLSSERNDLRCDLPKVSAEVVQTKRRVWDILNAGRNHRFTVEGLLVSNCLVLDYAPIETRNIAMMGDVLGIPLRRDSYIKDDAQPGETAGGFTFDGKTKWLAGSPAEIISRQLDYLDMTPWSWFREAGWMTLGLGKASDEIERTLVISPPQEGSQILYGLAKRDGGSWQAQKLAEGTFDELSIKADEICSRLGNATLAMRQRNWRREPPTDKQISYARRIKGAWKPGMTKGVLAQSITHHLALTTLGKYGGDLG